VSDREDDRMMQQFDHPERAKWDALCQRPAMESEKMLSAVQSVMDNVRLRGDRALIDLTARFDGVQLESLLYPVPENCAIDNELADAIKLAWGNIHRFHSAQAEISTPIETTPGVVCWRKSLPIERVGLYVPGGSAPLFSTLLMLGIPASIAGCKQIVVCTPPTKSGGVDPTILYVANLLGLKHIYTVGGAQAIAAMTFGTETIPKVDKIFGPGNQYVTLAKQLAQQQGVAIDMPAGPSEVLVIADATCNPAFVAADLLSQAEHGADSQVILLSDNENVLAEVKAQLAVQLRALPRKATAVKALENSRSILLRDLTQAIDFSNHYAPEHLILATDRADELAALVTQAGSVFIGHYSCESAGDYASGTNHTLPTNGYARAYSGVSLDSFVKKVTFQQLTADGLRNIGPAIERMAAAEQLDAHRNAVTIRLKTLNND
jgi:histidinol dehydrogenase